MEKTTFQKNPQLAFLEIVTAEFFKSSPTFCFASWGLHPLMEQGKCQDGNVCSRHDLSSTEELSSAR